MKITKIASSTVIVEMNNIKILSDPWIENGEYYGSWCLEENIDKNKAYKKMNECDYVFLSHIHPDHMSKKTFKNLNKNLKIIIHKFASNFVRKNLEIMGFQNIIELKHGETISLGNGVNIEIYAADDCNPEICGKIMGCNYDTNQIGQNSHQIDTCSIIFQDNAKVLNLNDCHVKLMDQTISRVLKKHKKIDYLLMNYSSAHSYPQCIENMSLEEKTKESEKIKRLSFKYSEKYLDIIKPRFFIPFAGEYFIGGKYSSYNDYYGVNSQNECFEYFSKSKYKKSLLMINYGKTYIEGEDNEFKIISHDKITEIKNSIADVKYDYEKDEFPKEKVLIELLKQASKKFFSKIKSQGLEFKENLAIKFFNNYFKLDLSKSNSSIHDKKEDLIDDNITILKIDERLLYKILLGPKYAHWNNADIGSHISYERINVSEYNYRLFSSISYFHS